MRQRTDTTAHVAILTEVASLEQPSDADRRSGRIPPEHGAAQRARANLRDASPDRTNAADPAVAGEDESYLGHHARAPPLQRTGSPRDIAEAIVFLIRSDFITGQVIYVDGGRRLQGYPAGLERSPGHDAR